MADTWEPAEAVAKNDAGEYVARFGDKWEPVKQAAKNDAGQFVVVRAVQAPGFGKKMDASINSVPRQIGLTARSGIEGVAGALGTVAEPIRYAMNLGGFAPWRVPTGAEAGTAIADTVGLPAPQTPTERIAGSAARTMAGGGALMAGARVAGAVGEAVPTARELIRQFTASPGTQTAAAAGAGSAGEYTKETGGSWLAQLLASIAGGVGAGAAVQLGKGTAEAAKSAFDRLRNPTAPTDRMLQVDIAIQNALGQTDFRTLPSHVRNQMRNDVQQAMETGNLTPAAVQRLADYRLADATPTRAGLTLDPVDITAQKNLAKVGANSRDPAVQLLARVENDNARRLGTGVQALAGDVVNDPYANSSRAVQALQAIDEGRATNVSNLYRQARESLGRAVPLDSAQAAKAANLALDEGMLGGSLPSAARQILNDVSTGKIPLTVDSKEQIVRTLGSMMSGASIRGDERAAIGAVRRALDNAPLTETHGLGPDALAAFRAGRTAHAARMAAQEATPALQAAAEGVQPDRFFQQFVIGNDRGNVSALQRMRAELGENSEAFRGLRGQLVAYLKAAGNVDEAAGTFGQAGFNNALRSIGDAKLRVFFNPDELARLRAIGRVAGYEQVQPRGSAVNNSNTASAAANILERLSDSSIATRIPIIGPMLERGAENAALRVRARTAADIPRALAVTLPQEAQTPVSASPALAALLAEQDDQRRRRVSGRE